MNYEEDNLDTEDSQSHTSKYQCPRNNLRYSLSEISIQLKQISALRLADVTVHIFSH